MKKHTWGAFFALGLGLLSIVQTPATAATAETVASVHQAEESNRHEASQASSGSENSVATVFENAGLGIATVGAGAWLTVAGRRKFADNCSF